MTAPGERGERPREAVMADVDPTQALRLTSNLETIAADGAGFINYQTSSHG